MSTWIPTMENYDSHILSLLKTIRVDDKPIDASYYMPEHHGDLDLHLKRPAVIFFLYDQVHDITREQSMLHQTVSTTSANITTTLIPTPVKYFYQFVILTDFKTHENQILRQFNALFPIRGYLTLRAPSGETASYDFFQKGFQGADAYLEVPNGGTTKARIFRKIYKYHLFTEIDDKNASTYKQVQAVSTRVNERM